MVIGSMGRCMGLAATITQARTISIRGSSRRVTLRGEACFSTVNLRTSIWERLNRASIMEKDCSSERRITRGSSMNTRRGESSRISRQAREDLSR